VIQLLLDPPHLADERLDLFEQQIPPQLLRRRGQGQLAEPHQTLLGPQTRLFRWDDASASEECANGVQGRHPPLAIRADGDAKGLAAFLVRIAPQIGTEEQLRHFANLF
jgi:hypothetical protein